MNISLFAFDLGPARNLALILIEALARGHRCFFVTNKNIKNFPLEEFEIFISGLSSFQNEEELEIGERAVAAGIPWLILADTHLSWNKQVAKRKVAGAIVIVASVVEIEMAKCFGYKKAVYLGGPPLWRTFSEAKSARIERLGEEKIILVGGIKSMVITNNMLEVVINAMEKIAIPWHLIFKPHQNEKKEESEFGRRLELLSSVNQMKRLETIDELLGSVDLSIHTSGATATISAAYQRRPVIYYEDEDVRQRIFQATGVESWFPAEMGACNLATPETMAREIEKLLFNKKPQKRLRRRQEELYPQINELPEKQILNFILSFS